MDGDRVVTLVCMAAYVKTLRWNCVTATDAELFQAPYRAGIDGKVYQLEPLRKALQMPPVGLFNADEVGLGKTIEAGLLIFHALLLNSDYATLLISWLAKGNLISNKAPQAPGGSANQLLR